MADNENARSGTKSARATYGGGPAFVAKAIRHEGDECFLWPNRIKAYPAFWEKGTFYYVHRVVCEAVHGPPPSSSHYQVAHKCGNRACSAPSHLRWDTASGNAADKISHDTHRRGERTPNVKLTAEQVRIIRAKPYAKGSGSELARKFGVSSVTICNIRQGATWSWLDGNKRTKT